MKIYTLDDSISGSGLVAAIGVFDGVHLGHRFLIEKIKQIAQSTGMQPAVVTFPRSPKALFDEALCPKLLTLPAEKDRLLEKAGIEVCIHIDFTHEIASLPAKDFIEILYGKLHIKHLLIGHDHRFGKGRTEGYEQYAEYGKSIGMQLHQVTSFLYNDITPVSSSLIRNLLIAGEAELANIYLGSDYSLTGKVTRGFRIGSNIGFPTANVRPDSAEKLIPAKGVYAVYVSIDGMQYKGMLNIGNNPTFHEHFPLSIEVHLFDFSEDIYDRNITITFIKYLREELKFSNKEELILQLNRDKEDSLLALK